MQGIEYVEFNITNVCNLNCTNCRNFNNYAFAGHQSWEQYVDTYTEWSKKFDIRTLAILGGEPMLHPEFLDWVHGIAKLWPTSQLVIVTNGTQFSRWPTLYQELYQYQDRLVINVSEHNQLNLLNTMQTIENFLTGPLTKEKLTGENSWQLCSRTILSDIPRDERIQLTDYKQLSPRHKDLTDRYLNDFPINQYENYIDNNGMRVLLTKEWNFRTTAVIHDPETNTVSLHDNNPETAVNVCGSCHHFKEGKLYKCGILAQLPDFTKQFKVDITPGQQELIDNYQPAEYTWTADELDIFTDGLNRFAPIPQCRLCPVNTNATKISAGVKKIKLTKI
jgi:organic radical activating enzyme